MWLVENECSYVFMYAYDLELWTINCILAEKAELYCYSLHISGPDVVPSLIFLLTFPISVIKDSLIWSKE